MGGVPSKPGDPSTKLEVIGAGYSKTGTMSMQMALEKLLKGPVQHGGGHLLWREDSFSKRWVQAYEARQVGDKQKVLKLVRQQVTGYAACTDMPNVDFLPELLELNPEAKVVLVTRDPARWWASIGVNLKHATPWYLPYLAAPMPGIRWFPSVVYHWKKTAMNLLVQAKGPGAPLDQNLIEVHNDWVKSLVPPERLLVMDLKEGWEPICGFLGKPIPDESFPQVNEAAEADKIGMSIFGKLILIWLGLFSSAGVGVYASVQILRNKGFIGR
ncbi:P-loop containing nucleoside triphosphate hydrolase protein [Xylariomycetidae sp. FL2044]|nr:P-loop containing nucleoside triphosphate hydrolase protein [Xylariomycetidae sp. FL2044]